MVEKGSGANGFQALLGPNVCIVNGHLTRCLVQAFCVELLLNFILEGIVLLLLKTSRKVALGLQAQFDTCGIR